MPRSAKDAARSTGGWIRDHLPRPVARVVERIAGEDLLLFAASLAFYALVSLVPVVIVTMWVASLVLGDDRVQAFADALAKAAPERIGIDDAVRQVATAGTTLGLVAIVAGLWPATSYGAGLVRAFDRLSPRPGRKLKGLRGRGLVLIVLLPLFVLGGLLGSYAGSTLLGESFVARLLGVIVGLVTGFLGACVGLALIYRIFPPDPLGWRDVLKATAIAAAGISVVSLVLSLYAALATNFEEHYASSGMALIVLIGVWLFLSNVMLLAGYRMVTQRS